MIGALLVEAALKYEGVPFFHTGRDENGLDCVGLPIRAVHDIGLTDWDDVDYSRQVDAAYLRSQILKFCDQISTLETQPGDILLFAIKDNEQHIAIRTELGMIHAWAEVNKVAHHPIDRYWRSRIRAAFRLRETEQWLP